MNQFETIHCNTNNLQCRCKQMQELYQTQYRNGTCVHFNECKEKKDPKPCWITFDWSAEIGSLFDLQYQGKPLRIVIMGKETTGEKNALKAPARLCNFNNGKLNRHYSATYKLLRYIFEYSGSQDAVLSMYALTNLYSCAFRLHPEQRRGVPNTDSQWYHCIDLKKEELKILAPTVLILQSTTIKAHHLYSDAKPISIELPDGYGALCRSDTHNCYIIESAHPAQSKYKWKNTLYACVDYLKEIDVLPKKGVDLTAEIDAMHI